MTLSPAPPPRAAAQPGSAGDRRADPGRTGRAALGRGSGWARRSRRGRRAGGRAGRREGGRGAEGAASGRSRGGAGEGARGCAAAGPSR